MSVASALVRRLVVSVLIASASLSAPVHADQSPILRIGVLDLSVANAPYEEGLREGLRELGYVEGKSLTIEWRRSTEMRAEFETAAAELVHSKVEVIVALGTPAARAALAATNSIPVVFWSGDPVGGGIAPMLGLQLITLDARNSAELEAALRAIPRNADGLVVSGDTLFIVNRFKIAGTLREARMPAIFPVGASSDVGLLISYGPNLKEAMRRMSVYVDKILKGAKPADLPIEQISKYELVINLRVAQELKLNVPQDLLLRADEVIR